jgi:hypothetical protein
MAEEPLIIVTTIIIIINIYNGNITLVLLLMR